MKKEKVESLNERVQSEIERENFNNIMFRLFEFGAISRKTIVEQFGFDYAEEVKNMAEEKTQKSA